VAALVSPWAYTSADASGNILSVTFTFDNTLLTILTTTTHRDVGCVYRNWYAGLGADGTPDSTTTKLTGLADGDSLIAVAILNGLGLTTITDVLAHQVTAGP